VPCCSLISCSVALRGRPNFDRCFDTTSERNVARFIVLLLAVRTSRRVHGTELSPGFIVYSYS
jgi:hypothetical protein